MCNRWCTCQPPASPTPGHLEPAGHPVQGVRLLPNGSAMADSATARVQGTVLFVDVLSGTSTKTDTPRPYRIVTARVLVADTGLAELRIPDRDFTEPVRGQDVDYLAEFSVYNGRLQGRAVQDLAA